MKRLFIILMLALVSVGMFAQKGTHSVSFGMHSFNNKIKFNVKDYQEMLLDVGYKYGISDLFAVSPSVQFCNIRNGKKNHKIDYGVNLDLNTTIFRYKGDIYNLNKTGQFELCAVTGVSYTGISESDYNGKKVGGRFGIGLEFLLSKIGMKYEATYNTLGQFEETFGLVYHF